MPSQTAILPVAATVSGAATAIVIVSPSRRS